MIALALGAIGFVSSPVLWAATASAFAAYFSLSKPPNSHADRAPPARSESKGNVSAPDQEHNNAKFNGLALTGPEWVSRRSTNFWPNLSSQDMNMSNGYSVAHNEAQRHLSNFYPYQDANNPYHPKTLLTNDRRSNCAHPIYKGVNSNVTLKFFGVTGPSVFSEHGIIQIGSPLHTLRFTTTHSNGFAREYLSIEGMQNVDTPVMRKNPDFSNAYEVASYLITPDLPIKFYYATQQGNSNFSEGASLDDTWKLVGCGP